MEKQQDKSGVIIASEPVASEIVRQSKGTHEVRRAFTAYAEQSRKSLIESATRRKTTANKKSH